MKSKLSFLVVLGFIVSFGAGCQNVKPWQRGTLSDYSMRGDRDPIGQMQDEHIFFSREMASGGRGVGVVAAAAIEKKQKNEPLTESFLKIKTKKEI